MQSFLDVIRKRYRKFYNYIYKTKLFMVNMHNKSNFIDFIATYIKYIIREIPLSKFL